MQRMMPRMAFFMMVMLAAPGDGFGQDADSVAMQRGREHTRQFYAGDMEPIVAAFNDQMRSAMGGTGGLDAFREQVIAQLGSEVEVLSERVTLSGPHRVYQRSVRFQNFAGPVGVVWAFDEAGLVAGFQIRPDQSGQQPAASRFLDYEMKAPLRLPFDDEWTVFWGGRTVAENYHAAYGDQRFAYDLVVVRDGSSHRGQGRLNEDYYCFGKPIVAPGAGVVVVARDGVADNVPGELESAVPPGNHVVIDHGGEEYSLLAHLRHGSVAVSIGERVDTGALLGECGNSGRSSEPHLHYHVQNSPDFGRGEGLPPKFNDYLADGTPVKRGEPVRGQRIRPAPESR